MTKVVPLHDEDALVMPLAGGATLRVTGFHTSPHVAVTLHGPAGGDSGGVLLSAERARLLASWLVRMADDSERHAPARRPPRAVRAR